MWRTGTGAQFVSVVLPFLYTFLTLTDAGRRTFFSSFVNKDFIALNFILIPDPINPISRLISRRRRVCLFHTLSSTLDRRATHALTNPIRRSFPIVISHETNFHKFVGGMDVMHTCCTLLINNSSCLHTTIIILSLSLSTNTSRVAPEIKPYFTIVKTRNILQRSQQHVHFIINDHQMSLL